MKKLVAILMAVGFVFVLSTASMAGHDCSDKKGKGHTSHGNGNGYGHNNTDPGSSNPGPSDPTGPGGPGSTGPNGSGKSDNEGGDGSAYGQDFCDSLADKFTNPTVCREVQ